MEEQRKTVNIFCCYAHEDKGLQDELKTHLTLLSRSGLINIWSDKEISPGAEWEKEIADHLNNADIILLLISADFIASSYCYDNEMKRALERHIRGEARVIPIIGRSVDFEEAPFSKLEMLPAKAKPIVQWPDKDEALTNVARGIRQVVNEIAVERLQIVNQQAFTDLRSADQDVLYNLYIDSPNARTGDAEVSAPRLTLEKRSNPQGTSTGIESVTEIPPMPGPIQEEDVIESKNIVRDPIVERESVTQPSPAESIKAYADTSIEATEEPNIATKSMQYGMILSLEPNEAVTFLQWLFHLFGKRNHTTQTEKHFTNLGLETQTANRPVSKSKRSSTTEGNLSISRSIDTSSSFPKLIRRVYMLALILLLLLGSSIGGYVLTRNLGKSSDVDRKPTVLAGTTATALAINTTATTAAKAKTATAAAVKTATDTYNAALNAKTVSHLSPLWSFQTSNAIYSSPAVANGVVYVGSDDHKLYAFDASCRSNCQPLWSFQAESAIRTSPAVANGVVYVGSDDQKLYALDASCRGNCQPIWFFSTGDRVQSSPIVDNGVIYVGSNDGYFYAFDATCHSNCRPLWSFDIGSFVSSPAVANGVVYVAGLSGGLYAFDATCHSNCQPLWSYQIGNYISSPTVANNLVYVAGTDGRLYAFDATCRSNCQPLWSYLANDMFGDPIVVNGVVYTTSDGYYTDNSKLYAFDATCHSNCQPLWSYQINGNTSSLTVTDSMVYDVSSDGKLYAFGLAS